MVSVLFGSCGTIRIQKRQHRGGWYIHHIPKNPKIDRNVIKEKVKEFDKDLAIDGKDELKSYAVDLIENKELVDTAEIGDEMKTTIIEHETIEIHKPQETGHKQMPALKVQELEPNICLPDTSIEKVEKEIIHVGNTNSDELVQDGNTDDIKPKKTWSSVKVALVLFLLFAATFICVVGTLILFITTLFTATSAGGLVAISLFGFLIVSILASVFVPKWITNIANKGKTDAEIARDEALEQQKKMEREKRLEHRRSIWGW